MEKEKTGEILVWTQEEYLQFSTVIKDRPASFVAFEILYWCGLRVGELLALTTNDFDFENNIMRITRSYQRIGREDIITEPKTDKSIRKVLLPSFLSEKIQEYISGFYELASDERIYSRLPSLISAMRCVVVVLPAVLREFKLHGLRHSHISLLADLGAPLVAIADRVGYENIDMTFQYAHAFPKAQEKMMEQLNYLKVTFLGDRF